MHRSLLGAGREQPLLLRGAKAAADRDRPATVSASEGESEQKSECSKRRNCSRRSDAVGWLVGAAQVKVGPGPGQTDRPTRQAGRLSSLAEWGKSSSKWHCLKTLRN